MEPELSMQPDWSSLPTAVLVHVFDNIFTFPTAHPSYLRLKAQAWTNLRRVCQAWKAAAEDTPVGVCLPARLPKPARDFVCSVILRGIEWHDPDHTDEELVNILAHPWLVERSGKTVQSIIDAPFNGKWKPSDFPNMTQLVVWRAHGASSCWDMSCIAGMAQLSYLVLASGFKTMSHTECWPAVCKHLVWTNPCDVRRSLLTLPALPRHVNLHWVSLRAYTVTVSDVHSLLGRVQQVNIHAGCILFKLPPTCFPSSLQTQPQLSPTSEQPVSGAVSGEASNGSPNGVRVKLDPSWPEEGLQSVASLLVNEHTMMSVRLKFSVVMISPPNLADQVRDRGSADDDDDEEWETASDTSYGPEEQQAAQQQQQQQRGAGQPGRRDTCRNCGRPRAPRRGERAQGDGDDDGDDDHGEEDGSGSEEEEEVEYAMQVYEPMAFDQVTRAFKQAVEMYAEMARARKASSALPTPAASTLPSSSRTTSSVSAATALASAAGVLPPPALDISPWGTGAGGGWQHSGSCGVDAASLPAYVVPVVEVGKYHPGAERELSVSRKWADPREPARLRLDQPAVGGMSSDTPELTFAAKSVEVLAAKQPVQALTFAPWPYTEDYLDRLAAQWSQQQQQQQEQQQRQEEGQQREQGAPHAAAPEGPVGSSGSDPAAQGEAANSCGNSGTQGAPEGLAVQLAGLQLGSQPCSQAAVTPSREQLLRFAALQQHDFLAHPRFLEASEFHLRKVNFLLIPQATLPAPRVAALLDPFVNLTKISLVLLDSETTYTTPIFPLSVVKVGLYATHPRQRFDSRCVSNLTEMWRLILTGFHSFDLSALPAVRPGFILKIVEVPATRTEPIGDPRLDVMLPTDHVIDMALQLGTDRMPGEDNAGADVNGLTTNGPAGVATAATQRPPVAPLPVTKVDLTAWAPLVRDLHVRNPSGVELHLRDCRDPPALFTLLSRSKLEHLTITMQVGQEGVISAGSDSAEGNGLLPVFAILLAGSGPRAPTLRLHGMTVGMMLHDGVVPGWSMETEPVDDGTEQEPGMVHIAMFRVMEGEQPAGPAAAAGLPPGAHAPHSALFDEVD